MTEIAPDNFKEKSKKRMMYLVEEDFYFLTYNAILILNFFKCVSAESAFKDYRKIAYLIDFVANKNLSNCLAISGSSNVTVKDMLVQSYAVSVARSALLDRIAYALEKRGILTIIADEEKRRVDWVLNIGNLPKDYFSNSFFKTEEENLLILKKHFSTVRTATLKATLKKLYHNHGVSTWQD